MELSQTEMYCTAKILQSVLFSDDRGLFHGCNNCKFLSECMPDKKPHDNMIFDNVREKLQKITTVNLSILHQQNVFDDITTC